MTRATPNPADRAERTGLRSILTDALASWPHAFVVLDAQRRRVLAFNPRFETLMALPSERASELNSTSVDWLVEACAPALADPAVMSAALRDARVLGRVALRDGALLEVSVHRLDHAWLVIFEEATARLRAEDERRTVERRMRELERLEGLGALAGGIAHEFNNLLTGILGSAELVREQLAPEDPRRRLLERILEAGSRAAGLCEEMVASAGPGSFLVRRLHLSDLVRHTLRLLQPSTPTRVRIEERLSLELPSIAGDEEQLRRVFESVFLNACEALEARGGVVRVTTGVSHLSTRELESLYFASTAPEGDFVWFEVADDGPGMDAATQARMFDPFFSTKFAGRGLGLSSVAHIVRAHKGAVEVDSQPGRGTRLRVLAPAFV